MRLAYLILAHNNPNQLQRLISRLANDYTDIFVHIDKKADNKIAFYNTSNLFNNICFIKKQVSVRWGGFSMIEATLNGLSEIMEHSGAYDYISLISGADFPVRKNEEILRFFQINNGKEFICCWKTPSPELPLGGRDRIEYYHNYDNLYDNKKSYENEMKARGIKREFINGMVPYHGSQWWSLTSRCVSFILDFVESNKELINYYRYTKFPDEQFFQTIVMNSGFAQSAANDNLRYIDWSNNNMQSFDWINSFPHPKTLTIHDFQRIINSSKLFARKFDESIDRAILDLIDTIILSYNKPKLSGIN